MFEISADGNRLSQRPLLDPFDFLTDDFLAATNNVGNGFDGYTSTRHSCLEIRVQ